AGVGAVLDVGVGVRSTGNARVRIALALAERHAEPEGRVKLEVPGSSASVLLRRNRRLARDPQVPDVRVPRPGLARVEEQSRLVVTDVLALVVLVRAR